MGARVCSQKECCSNGYSLREIYTVSALLPNPLTAEELWKIVLKKKNKKKNSRSQMAPVLFRPFPTSHTQLALRGMQET